MTPHGLIGRRGFYAGPDTLRLSCHWNGYGEGSQFALCVGERWYGWWSDGGWAIKDQKPLAVTLTINGVSQMVVGTKPARDGAVVIRSKEDFSSERAFEEGR